MKYKVGDIITNGIRKLKIISFNKEKKLYLANTVGGIGLWHGSITFKCAHTEYKLYKNQNKPIIKHKENEMKVFKAYYLWNDEKHYIKNRGNTEIFASQGGVKRSIAELRKYSYKNTKFYIEEYDCVLTKESEL